MKETRKEMQERISRESYYRNMTYISPSEAAQIASNLKTIENEANKLGVGRKQEYYWETHGEWARVLAEGIVWLLCAVVTYLIIPLLKYLFKVTAPVVKPYLVKVKVAGRKHPYIACFFISLFFGVIIFYLVLLTT